MAKFKRTPRKKSANKSTATKRREFTETKRVLKESSKHIPGILQTVGALAVLIILMAEGCSHWTNPPYEKIDQAGPGGVVAASVLGFTSPVASPAKPVANTVAATTPATPTDNTMAAEPAKPVATSKQPAGIIAGTYTEQIPDGRGNYRVNGKITRAQLEAEFATGKYKYLLRLNGDEGRDRGVLSSDEMMAIAAAGKVRYVTFKHDKRFNAHAGYEPGIGYFDSYAAAYPCFLDGGVLIVSRGNKYRNGSLVGAWLAANGYTWEEIIKLNKWEKVVDNPSAKELRYIETVKGQLQ